MKKINLIVGVLLVLGGVVYIIVAKPYSSFKQGQVTGNKNSNDQSIVVNTTLDLSNKNLEKIPDYVFDRSELEELNVSHNKLNGGIQSQIGRLKNLKILNASNNLMTGVPAEIGQLTKLESLDLSNNQLTGLPNELGNLKNLKTLNLSGNDYSVQDLNGIRANLPSSVNIIVK